MRKKQKENTASQAEQSLSHQPLTLKQRTMILSRRDRAERIRPSWWRVLIVIVVLFAALFVLKEYQNSKRYSVSLDMPSEDERQLTFVGDICLGRYVEKRSESDGFDALFADARQLWADSDLVFANLECAVIDPKKGYTPADKKIHLEAKAEGVEAMKRAGVDVVSIANNHAGDYGIKGLRYEMSVLEGAGLTYAGAGENTEDAIMYKLIDLDGLKIGFVAFSDVLPAGFSARTERVGIAASDAANLYLNVLNASAEADIVVVYAHWGKENAIVNNATQTQIAQQLIDSGADIVVGSHPHVLQSVEFYNGGVIFYSLGNFVFDQGTRDSRDTVMVQMNADVTTGDCEFTLIPMRINDFAPEVTGNSLYLNQIHRDLTKNLDESSYTISEDGCIRFTCSLFTPGSEGT